MTTDDLSNLLQLLAILAAVGASMVALIIAGRDRENARRIAHEDRRASLRQSQLTFEWDAACRLSINLARGGHSDPAVSKDMGAEALALVALLGPERVPNLWARRVGHSDRELREMIEDESKEQFVRDAIEAERAMNDIASEIRSASDGT